LGLFEEANKGTLFLDEISNTPFATQGKLLEAIEEKKIRRLGETAVRKVDVRLVSATNQNLMQMVDQGLFRADLFYRIGVITLHIPPLRERATDIPLLAKHFLEKHAYQMNKRIEGFDEKTMELMLSYPWPGNVRELSNVIERAAIFAQNRYILPSNLKLDRPTHKRSLSKHYKREDIISALDSAKGNISVAARILDVTRVTVYHYLRKYKIRIPQRQDRNS
jgi:transcriptional regulator with PAS, ATPase and Fis domain